MDKDILRQYIDACELVKETEEDIRRHRRQRRCKQDVVKGSMAEFPYTAKRFHLEDDVSDVVDKQDEEEEILRERRQKAEEIKMQAERFVNQAPVRMQRIIRMKVFQDCTWDLIAVKLGRGATAESVRKEYYRFMKKD